MTTKELENKLKITKYAAIHCSTLELAKQVLNIFHKLGLTWRNGISYTPCTDWDKYKENTIYFPFEGRFSSLKHFQQLSGKIISAEEFITLHTEKEEFDLENYIPKGQLEGFPKEIIARMLECQEEQGNKRDITVFEKNILFGFIWDKTKENLDFWNQVITYKNFDLFFEKYPKQDNQDNSQEFKVGDKVYDIILGKVGIIKKIILNNVSVFPMEVYYEDYGIILYTLGGKYLSFDKYSRLLHYRDDYNYDIIDFNNLPKRQEPKRWRAEEGGVYHFVNYNKEGWFFSDDSRDDYDYSFDNNNYNSGNYFRTEVEAEIIAQKLNSYFKQLIKEEHDTHRN